jgi:hypothetical protein
LEHIPVAHDSSEREWVEFDRQVGFRTEHVEDILNSLFADSDGEMDFDGRRRERLHVCSVRSCRNDHRQKTATPSGRCKAPLIARSMFLTRYGGLPKPSFSLPAVTENNTFVFTSPTALRNFGVLALEHRQRIETVNLRPIAKLYDVKKRKHFMSSESPASPVLSVPAVWSGPSRSLLTPSRAELQPQTRLDPTSFYLVPPFISTQQDH